jgi:protein TonB
MEGNCPPFTRRFVPRKATPPKTDIEPRPRPELAAVLRPVAAQTAARKGPAAPKPLIVDPVVPAVAEPVRQGPPRRTARIAPAGALPPAVIPREALASPRHDRLLIAAVTISVLIHLVVLTIHFRPFDLKPRNDKGPPLEVALVNAKTVAKPAKADILAQANLDGGGNTDANRRARTPLPVLPKPAPDQQVAVATQKVEALEKQTRELMTQLRNQAVPQSLKTPTDVAEKTDLPTANELMQKTLEAMRLEAQIARDMEAYQKRPKRRFIGARAEEYRFARYVEDWRLKVEQVGNNNYPEAARQKKLYGSLLLTVSIKADGSLENVEINRGSGSRILDAAAVKIVEMSAPFAAFPPEIKRDTDILHITRTWTFTKADTLEGQQ